MLRKTFLFCLIAIAAFGLSYADDETVFKALGAPAHRKVDVAWNRFHDIEGLGEILQRLHEAYPKITKLYSIGESYQGRPVRVLEVTNREIGDPDRKPGMYIDGNIHGNEVQAGEVVAYTAWYLCENYGKVDLVTDLVDTRVLYIIPSVNPDGRDYWFHHANTQHSSRTGQIPTDEDKDGLVDEDPFDDLDGDGSITMMRKRDPNGRYLPDKDYPEYQMRRAEPDERGEYDILGYEGLDNDGDGQVNEDNPGGYDPNRNWAYDWQPHYVQYWAKDFPFSFPAIRAVGEFVLKHPNIAGMLTFHNYGGLILRGPNRNGGPLEPGDERVMFDIAKRGERMLPLYRNVVSWEDLYPVWGGQFDWFYAGRGITAFTNELWTPKNMFRSNETSDKAEGDFLRYVLLNDGVVKWKPFNHPQYGEIEIGGIKKEFGRTPPSFLLEEECHRNMAFALYHASQTPLLEFGEIKVEPLREGLAKVWVEIRNQGMIPTRLQIDIKNNINRADLVMLSGKGIEVISGGRVTDQYFNRVDAVKARPERLMLDRVPGMGSERVQFIVSGRGKAKVVVDSLKGGRIETDIELP
ncbi:peptidase M14 [bacterium]|nr:peptidase M14 [bacterium]